MQPLFRLAILKGATASVLIHIRRGAPINGRDSRGLTPLMLAAASGREDICNLLLEEGADALATTADGRTASSFANAAGYVRLTNRLMPKQAHAEVPAPFVAQGVNDSFEGAVAEHDDNLSAWDGDDWEVEEAFRPSNHDSAVLPTVRDVQSKLSIARALNCDPDWREVKVYLPTVFRLQAGMEAHLTKAIANAMARERMPFAEFRQLTSKMDGIASILADLGIEVETTAFESFITSQVASRSLNAADHDRLAEAEELLEALRASASAETMLAAEAELLPYVDRGTEQSMFRALDASRRALFRMMAEVAAVVPEVLGPAAGDVSLCDEETKLEEDAAPSSAMTTGGQHDFEHDGTGSDGPTRKLADILLSLSGQVSPVLEEMFEGVDMDPDLADALAKGLLARKMSAEAERLSLALRRYLQDRNRIVEANVPLILKIAPRYARGRAAAGDLAQEASIGLLRAVERFEFERGNRFATYAVWWIRQSCGRAVEDLDRTVRLPVHFIDNLKRVQALRLQLSHRLCREPNEGEILHASGIPSEKLRQMEELALPVAEMDDPGSSNVVTRIVSNSEDGFDMALARQRRIMIAEAVAELGGRDAEVVRRRFGLGTGDEETLEEIGRDMGVTRERIRQIEARALRILAKPGGRFGRRLRLLL